MRVKAEAQEEKGGNDIGGDWIKIKDERYVSESNCPSLDEEKQFTSAQIRVRNARCERDFSEK